MLLFFAVCEWTWEGVEGVGEGGFWRWHFPILSPALVSRCLDRSRTSFSFLFRGFVTVSTTSHTSSVDVMSCDWTVLDVHSPMKGQLSSQPVLDWQVEVRAQTVLF